MVKALNKEIARKCFASLILDFEYSDVVICRVLIDGYFCANLTAENRQAAIENLIIRIGGYNHVSNYYLSG